MTTPQQQADAALAVWQIQRLAGIAPEDRRLPAPANDKDSYERDLAIIRKLMERM